MLLSKMKFFKLIFITLLIFVSTIPANATQETDILDFLPAILAASRSNSYYHLFILSGQSNMEYLDVDSFFTPIVTEEFGENVIVVKYAVAGSEIAWWYRDSDGHIGDHYINLMANVHAATEGKYLKTVTFVWMQGERDAVLGTTTYKDDLLGLIDLVGQEFARNVNFVIGRLSPEGIDYYPPYWNDIRTIQVEVAEGSQFGTWVDTDDLVPDPGSGDVHFWGNYDKLGERFALEAISLIDPN